MYTFTKWKSRSQALGDGIWGKLDTVQMVIKGIKEAKVLLVKKQVN